MVGTAMEPTTLIGIRAKLNKTRTAIVFMGTRYYFCCNPDTVCPSLADSLVMGVINLSKNAIGSLETSLCIIQIFTTDFPKSTRRIIH